MKQLSSLIQTLKPPERKQMEKGIVIWIAAGRELTLTSRHSQSLSGLGDYLILTVIRSHTSRHQSFCIGQIDSTISWQINDEITTKLTLGIWEILILCSLNKSSRQILEFQVLLIIYILVALYHKHSYNFVEPISDKRKPNSIHQIGLQFASTGLIGSLNEVK